MSGLFTTVVLVLEALLLLPIAYLLFLTLAGLFYRARTVRGITPSTRFAVLVPAHNEEKKAPLLMKSIEAAGYPVELSDVYVVADNCTDETVKSLEQYRCQVFSRNNDSLIGKGHALKWLLDRIRATGKQYDAFVFLDSDCEVSANFFAVLDDRFQRGELAVQTYYTTANPKESWVSSLRHMALVLLHHGRPSGREVLGLSCGIFGTGMAFHNSVVDRFGWETHGLAEDVEYFMLLTENGIRVSFAREAEVLSDMPPTLRAARSQNERWERGRLEVARKYVPKFFFGGIASGSAIKVDAAVEQAIPPLSIVGLASVALLIGSIFTGSTLAIAAGTAAVLALAAHVLISLAAARTPFAVLVAVAYVPWYVLWKLVVYVKASLPGSQKWVRTER